MPKRRNDSADAKKQVARVLRDAQQAATAETERRLSYDPAIAQAICEGLSEGIPLRELCRREGMPPYRTLYSWIERDADLAAHIARAREIGYDSIAEECLEIADNASNDWVDREQFNPRTKRPEMVRVVDQEHIQRSKLRIETRLKLLAKWRPAKYGERVAVTGAADGAPIKTEGTGSDALLEIIRNMELRRRAASE